MQKKGKTEKKTIENEMIDWLYNYTFNLQQL